MTSRFDIFWMSFWRRRRLHYFLAAALAIGVAEVFTPIAPLQRLAGAGVSVLPDNAKATILSQEAVSRLSSVDRLISENQADHTIRARTGSTLVRKGNLEFPPVLREALISVEDHRYRSNFVLDYPRIATVLGQTLWTGTISGGASGIAMQAARTIVLRDHSSTISRKLKEITVALELRTRFSARELVTYYLATAYLGRDVRGFAEAARAYLGKPVQRVTLAESVLLVSLLKAPNRYLDDPEALEDRYEVVVASLYYQGLLGRKPAQRMLRDRPRIQTEKRSRSEWPAVAHFTRTAREKAEQTVVRTTLDPKLSQAALAALRDAVSSVEQRTGVEDATGFFIAGRGNGTVLSMIGGTQPYTPNAAVRKTAWRPGSVMKPLLYGSFYETGGIPTLRLPVRPESWDREHSTWNVRNYTDRYEEFDGGLPAAYCLSRSLNVPASFLSQSAVGDSTFAKLGQVGIILEEHPANLIGASSMRPDRLYASLLSFVRPYGAVPRNLRYRRDREVQMTRLYDRTAARNTALNLALVVDDSLGTAHRAKQLFGWEGRRIRAKTGTGQDYTSATLFAVRPGLSVLIGVYSREGEQLRYGGGRGVTGATLTPFINQFYESTPAKRYHRRSRFDVPETRMKIESPEWLTVIPWER